MSDAKALWAAALTSAQSDMPTIPKTQTADTGSYSYSYADLTDIIEAIRKPLTANGLSFTQAVVSEGNMVGVTTTLHHEAGHSESFGPLLLAAGKTPQQAGSAITYARRYSLTAALGIATDDDIDGAGVEPVKEEPEQNPAGWLANAVEAFGLWTPDERRGRYTQAMNELDFKRLSSMDRAKEVFEYMAEWYYTDHPEAGPF